MEPGQFASNFKQALIGFAALVISALPRWGIGITDAQANDAISIFGAAVGLVFLGIAWWEVSRKRR